VSIERRKPKPSGSTSEHAVAEDLLAGLGALLHDREHQLLLAQARDVVDLQILAHLMRAET
jgi:hypothetical protein